MSLPRIRSDLVLVEQTYRGELSYIVKDPTTHKYFRFRPLEVAVMRVLQHAATAAEAVGALAEEGIKVTAATVSKFAERLKSMGAEPVGSTAAEFGTRIQSDLATIGRVVKASGMKVD